MPEYPDIRAYTRAMTEHLVGQRLQTMRIGSGFVLRTVSPSPDDLAGRLVTAVTHMAKQLVIALESDYYVVIHLMISGRLKWRKPGAALPRKSGLAAWDFDHGSLLLTEVSRRKRASIHVILGATDLMTYDRGGLDPLHCSLEEFRTRLTQTGHTLKRALTDQRLLAGIGNAYSDEILFAARLSPLQLTANLKDGEWQRLHLSMINTLTIWTARLSDEAGQKFPKKVTAFRPQMAVHGKYRQPCPVCGSPVQRIQYTSREANYCARCQTGGRLLSDRVLARLLKSSWPKTIDELE